jgi:predicted dehydrogenase
MKILATIILIIIQAVAQSPIAAQTQPLRVAVAGLTHGHVNMVLRAANRGDIVIVGVSETNRDLAERLLKQYNLSVDLLYPSLEAMLLKVKPEAVTAFGSIYDHLSVVQACAPKKIHVMVEKPLAVSLDHAKQMEALAKKHNIHLVTNYETTWYGSNHHAYKMLHDENNFGSITKIVVHDGHQGPKEIGVNKEFLEWLTDPRLNGGGALMDFGCYGADLITWLMKGEKPVSVTAVTQQIKPEVYPKVDDEATIIVTYPKAQGIIQASWNWPYGRKDMEVYGKTGYIFADGKGIRFVKKDSKEEQTEAIPPRTQPYDDPFRFLAAVIRGEITMSNQDLSSLPINMTAMQILDAASQSAKTGKVIYIKKD